MFLTAATDDVDVQLIRSTKTNQSIQLDYVKMASSLRLLNVWTFLLNPSEFVVVFENAYNKNWGCICVACDVCLPLISLPEHKKRSQKKPTDSWLAFLNVQVQITAGTFKTKWYQKPASKNILIHFSSVHPSNTKKAIIRNMMRTATTVSSGSDEKAESLEKVQITAGTFKTKWYQKPASKNILIHFSSVHPSNTKKAIIRNMMRTATTVSSGSDEKAESLEKVPEHRKTAVPHRNVP
ncbi:hypothetical protein OSTOST_02817 [Ostertagia ostertagi]